MSRNLYKKKGLGDVDHKSKRILRRSIHQKDVRGQGFLTRRPVDDDLSPLKDESFARPAPVAKRGNRAPRQIVPPVSKAIHKDKATTRREQLNKWREEKEMKRKIEQMERERNRPSFKVAKVDPKQQSRLPRGDAPQKKPAKKETTKAVPVVRRSSRLATTKDNPAPTKTRQPKPVATKSQSTTRTFTTGVKSTRVPPAPIGKKPAKKTAPKSKEPAFPTVKSFTFKKEVAAPPKNSVAAAAKKVNASSLRPMRPVGTARLFTVEGRVTRQATSKSDGTATKRGPATGSQSKNLTLGQRKPADIGTKKGGAAGAARSGRIPVRGSSATQKTAPRGNSSTRAASSTRTKSSAGGNKVVKSGGMTAPVDQAKDQPQELPVEVGPSEEQNQQKSAEDDIDVDGDAPGEMMSALVVDQVEDQIQGVPVRAGSSEEEQDDMEVDGDATNQRQESEEVVADQTETEARDEHSMEVDGQEREGMVGETVQAREEHTPEMAEMGDDQAEKSVEPEEPLIVKTRQECMTEMMKAKPIKTPTVVGSGKSEPSSDTMIDLTSERSLDTSVKDNGMVDAEFGVTEAYCSAVVVSEEDKAGADSFQSTMDKERVRMSVVCSSWEDVMAKEDIPDDVSGDLRSAIGKAQLLINERFNQFEGLIEQCRLGLGEKRTHTKDLQGFWDMIYYQIEDVDKMFATLAVLQSNNWTQVEKEVKAQPAKTKGKKKKVIKKPVGDANAARERLAAFKAALKESQTTDVPLSPTKFKKAVISTPVKKIVPDGGASAKRNTPLKRVSLTPRGSAKRPSLAPREQHLLWAVLQASQSPKRVLQGRRSGHGTTPNRTPFSLAMSPNPRIVSTPGRSGTEVGMPVMGASLFTPEKVASPARVSTSIAEAASPPKEAPVSSIVSDAEGCSTPQKSSTDAPQEPLPIMGASIFTPEKMESPARMTPLIARVVNGHGGAPTSHTKSVSTPGRAITPMTVISPMTGAGIFSPLKDVSPSSAEEGEILSDSGNPSPCSDRKRKFLPSDKSLESESGGEVDEAPGDDAGENALAMQYLMATQEDEDQEMLASGAGSEEAPVEEAPELDASALSDKVFSALQSTPATHLALEAMSSECMDHTPSKLAKVEDRATETSPPSDTDTSVVTAGDVEGADSFQGVMNGARECLTSSCSSWSQVLESQSFSAEVSGDIRSAIGKAHLLMNQRFKQFEGLIEQCRRGLGEKRTHTTDLQGFWDMVHFQVEDVHGLFAELSERKENGWVAKEEEAKPVVKKVAKRKTAAKTRDTGAAGRKAARQRLAAAKAALKKEQAGQSDTVVFDAGFFRVESPVKTGEHLCMTGIPCEDPAGTASPRLMQSTTPPGSPWNSARKTPERTPLGDRERNLLRAVLRASMTPKMDMMELPGDSGGIFSPVGSSVTPSTQNEMVTRLRDLGLSSTKASARKRRISPRNRDASREGNVEKENECDLSRYLMPSTPSASDLISGSSAMLKTTPLEAHRGLSVRTPLGDRKDKQNGADIIGQPPSKPGLQDDSFDGPVHTPRRSMRVKPGRVSAFTPPRRSFANVPPPADLMSFD